MYKWEKVFSISFRFVGGIKVTKVSNDLKVVRAGTESGFADQVGEEVETGEAESFKSGAACLAVGIIVMVRYQRQTDNAVTLTPSIGNQAEIIDDTVV